ncbi:hypothetical protein EYC80_004919 [Monilinia laxa]|uniref:BTB domain-containing protein n=1 Tax=Monilinia laxa TaxID=61186 RepID=A0A5N6KIJ4_MONLA|nr:hypothetical protein EYC80_004919 [Monilinia laxa]
MAHLTANLSDQFVQILVSSELKEFSVHKTLIRSTRGFFDKGFDGRLKEVIESKMFLPEDDPDTFEIFVNWMYAGNLRHDLYPMQIINVWIFAQKYLCQKLKNNAMDALQDALYLPCEYSLPLNYVEVARIFDNTTDIRDCLRHFAAVLLAWEIRNGNPYNIEYLEKILRGVGDSLENVLMFLRHNKDVFDPRIRGGAISRCTFHDHTGDSQLCNSALTIAETATTSSSTPGYYSS